MANPENAWTSIGNDTSVDVIRDDYEGEDGAIIESYIYVLDVAALCGSVEGTQFEVAAWAVDGRGNVGETTSMEFVYGVAQEPPSVDLVTEEVGNLPGMTSSKNYTVGPLQLRQSPTDRDGIVSAGFKYRIKASPENAWIKFDSVTNPTLVTRSDYQGEDGNIESYIYVLDVAALCITEGVQFEVVAFATDNAGKTGESSRSDFIYGYAQEVPSVDITSEEVGGVPGLTSSKNYTMGPIQLRMTPTDRDGIASVGFMYRINSVGGEVWITKDSVNNPTEVIRNDYESEDGWLESYIYVLDVAALCVTEGIQFEVSSWAVDNSGFKGYSSVLSFVYGEAQEAPVVDFITEEEGGVPDTTSSKQYTIGPLQLRQNPTDRDGISLAGFKFRVKAIPENAWTKVDSVTNPTVVLRDDYTGEDGNIESYIYVLNVVSLCSGVEGTQFEVAAWAVDNSGQTTEVAASTFVYGYANEAPSVELTNEEVGGVPDTTSSKDYTIGPMQLRLNPTDRDGISLAGFKYRLKTTPESAWTKVDNVNNPTVVLLDGYQGEDGPIESYIYVLDVAALCVTEGTQFEIAAWAVDNTGMTSETQSQSFVYGYANEEPSIDFKTEEVDETPDYTSSRSYTIGPMQLRQNPSDRDGIAVAGFKYRLKTTPESVWTKVDSVNNPTVVLRNDYAGEDGNIESYIYVLDVATLCGSVDGTAFEIAAWAEDNTGMVGETQVSDYYYGVAEEPPSVDLTFETPATEMEDKVSYDVIGNPIQLRTTPEDSDGISEVGFKFRKKASPENAWTIKTHIVGGTVDPNGIQVDTYLDVDGIEHESYYYPLNLLSSPLFCVSGSVIQFEAYARDNSGLLTETSTYEKKLEGNAPVVTVGSRANTTDTETAETSYDEVSGNYDIVVSVTDESTVSVTIDGVAMVQDTDKTIIDPLDPNYGEDNPDYGKFIKSNIIALSPGVKKTYTIIATDNLGQKKTESYTVEGAASVLSSEDQAENDRNRKYAVDQLHNLSDDAKNDIMTTVTTKMPCQYYESGRCGKSGGASFSQGIPLSCHEGKAVVILSQHDTWNWFTTAGVATEEYLDFDRASDYGHDGRWSPVYSCIYYIPRPGSITIIEGGTP